MRAGYTMIRCYFSRSLAHVYKMWRMHFEACPYSCVFLNSSIYTILVETVELLVRFSGKNVHGIIPMKKWLQQPGYSCCDAYTCYVTAFTNHKLYFNFYVVALMLWHFINVKTPLLNTFLSLSNDTFAERKKGVVPNTIEQKQERKKDLQQSSKPLICI